MRIALIDCEKVPDYTTDHYDGYPCAHTEPLGLEYLASYLENNGHETQIIQLPDDKLENVVKDAEIIGFSVLTYQWPYFKEIVKRIRNLNPEAILVAGREHPTAMPELCLTETAIDYVICGEGEIPLLQVADGVSPREIRSLAYREGENIVVNPRTQRLKKWSRPKRDKKRMTVTLKEWSLFGERSAGIMLSRGCCFDCCFCTKQKMWGNDYITQNIDATIDEIVDTQQQYSVEVFAFHDLMFPPNFLEIFCRKILERRVNAKFFGMMSVSPKPIDWQIVKSAGFFEFGIGLEIPSDKRKGVGKNYNFATAKNFINSIARAGILTRVYTIIGWPSDINIKDIVSSFMKGLSEVSTDVLRVNFVTPFPGTKLWNDYRKNFIYPVPNGLNHFTTMEPVVQFKLCAKDLIQTRLEIIKTFQSKKNLTSTSSAKRINIKC